MEGKKEIIKLLLNEGLVTEEMVAQAEEEIKRTGLSLDKALEKLGFISEEDIVKTQAMSLNFPYMDLTDYIIDSEIIKLIPEYIAKKYKVVPLFKIGKTLTVGMVDPHDVVALDQVRKISQLEMVDPMMVSEKSIQKVVDYFYGVAGSIEDVIESLDKEQFLKDESKGLMEIAGEAPIVKLVNIILAQSVRERASDIHVEPEENSLRVRLRIDGVLHDLSILPKKFQNAIISRIKILSKIDIAEMRKPQDGRIRIKLENKDLDIRVSTFPTVHGENVVMRLLDKTSVLLGLKDLGLLEDDLDIFDKMIRSPNGIIFVTGPTGSGKTTTLYSALTSVSSVEKNIITIEDPVEYELPLIRQTQINPKAGITFANGLRHILRQDPDIIMVGEIRDKDTAEVAIQSALTGHLVFSTLHTNDAASALTRLGDMGVEPFLVSTSTVGIIAQRLVRMICDKCKEAYSPSGDLLDELKLPQKTKFFKGKGCKKCKKTGFKGRIGIFEILKVTPAIRTLVEAKSSADAVKKEALKNGRKTLLDDGLVKVKKGMTTIEEVLRVTQVEM